MPLERSCPLRRGIGARDKLRSDFAGRAPCSVVERVEIFLHRTARRGERWPIHGFRAGNRTLLVGVGRNQGGVHREALAADQTFFDATADDSFKNMPEGIALSEAAVAVLRKCGMIRDFTL